MSNLTDTVAIVTGGTGALGSAVVVALLEAGASVFVPFHRAGELEKLREQASLPSDAPLSGQQLDLTDETAVAQCYTTLAERSGRIDSVVNVAGGFGGGDPIHKTPWSLWQQQLDLNLKTAVLSCASAVPHMLARGGAIINVSSRTAAQSGANLAAYGVSKRGVIGLTEALAAELRPHNIRVNAVLPSVIDTPANRASSPDADYSDWVKPIEIARVIRFLASPDARIISGAAIPVYGKA